MKAGNDIEIVDSCSSGITKDGRNHWVDVFATGPTVEIDPEAAERKSSACKGYCCNEFQVQMAKVACIDYRDNTRPGLFYDEYRDDQGALQVAIVFKGRGVVIAENVKKVVVTDDVVVACC